MNRYEVERAFYLVAFIVACVVLMLLYGIGAYLLGLSTALTMILASRSIEREQRRKRK